MPIVIKSPEELKEDYICKTHTSVCRDLNTMIGGSSLYKGVGRAKAQEFKEYLELIICGQEPMPTMDKLAKMHLRYL